MKKYLLFVVSSLFVLKSFSQQDPVLLDIEGKKVTKSEFLQIYLKNNPNPKYDKQSLDEYMELFKKFQLKVIEAESLGYDTIPKLKKELEGYRKQLATPYLIDSAMNQELVKEAYERTKKEIRASHILLRLDPNALPSDTLRVYNRLLEIKKRIENGEDFATVAKGKMGSEDPSVVNNGGDLGFFTAFQMVYPFEDAAYKTPVGSVSMPIRTRFGYHLIKVTDERKARGTLKTAHIMISVPKGSSQDEIESASKKANEIYDKLKAGENFEELVKKYSDDPSSNGKGGILPAFGTGTTTRMVTSFEDAAFGLKNNGDYSKPIQTDYGFHIIKRVEWTDVPTFEVAKKELQSKVNKDERSLKTQESYVKKLKKEYHFKDKSAKTIGWFNENIDTLYFSGKWNASKLNTNKTLFVLDGKKFTQKDFAKFLENNQRGVKKEDITTLVKAQFIKWEKEAILNYEESKLDKKYPEFKALLSEYHDGIILYEIMTDKVWNKAMKDTTGLKEYFEKNRANYMWGKRANAMVYECSNKTIAEEVYKMVLIDTINSKHVLDKINKDSELNLRVKTNKYDIENTPFLKGQANLLGVNKIYEFDGKFYVVKISELLPPGQKELSESKGIATSDYQNYIEKNWLDELLKRHPIKINESVLYSIGK
ncbi:MAG: peptidylprolyl isomerase [Flavobacteriia bacterium]|nr:peptidylprolyl isomerase [Flavobacteriia bacterium]